MDAAVPIPGIVPAAPDATSKAAPAKSPLATLCNANPIPANAPMIGIFFITDFKTVLPATFTPVFTTFFPAVFTTFFPAVFTTLFPAVVVPAFTTSSATFAPGNLLALYLISGLPDLVVGVVGVVTFGAVVVTFGAAVGTFGPPLNNPIPLFIRNVVTIVATVLIKAVVNIVSAFFKKPCWSLSFINFAIPPTLSIIACCFACSSLAFNAILCNSKAADVIAFAAANPASADDLAAKYCALAPPPSPSFKSPPLLPVFSVIFCIEFKSIPPKASDNACCWNIFISFGFNP